MEQAERAKALKENPQQAKQLSVMMEITNEAFRKNMSAYIKLVQMDVMKEFNARCDADGVGGDRVKFSHGIMDPIMKQVDADLEKQIMAQFKKLKENMSK